MVIYFSLLLLVFSQTPGCPLHFCANISQEEVCLVIDQTGSPMKFYHQPCIQGQCMKNTTYMRTCQQPQKPLTKLFPGQKCEQNFECKLNCKNNVCLGLSQGEFCEVHQDCNPGLRCTELGPYLACSPLLKQREQGCTTDYDCQNNLGCLLVQQPGICVPYFQLQTGTQLSPQNCPGSSSILCQNMYCTSFNSSYYCSSQIKSQKETPVKCSDAKTDCLSNPDTVTGTAGSTGCACGLNQIGQAYCYAFYGDPVGQDYQNQLLKWIESQEIFKCNTKGRLSQKCLKDWWSHQDYWQLVYYSTRFQSFPGTVQAPYCAIQNIIPKLAQAQQELNKGSICIGLIGLLTFIQQMKKNSLNRSNDFFGLTQLSSPKPPNSVGVNQSHSSKLPSQRKIEWEKFLQSTEQTGNMKPLNTQPSQRLLDSLAQIDKKIATSRPATQQVQSTTFRKVVQAQTKGPQVKLLSKQKQFNILHHEVIKKQNLISKLYDEYKSLQKTSGKTKNLRETCKLRKEEFDQIFNAIQNQQYYSYILKHMIKVRRQELRTEEQPISVLNQQIRVMNQKLKLNQLQIKRLQQQDQPIRTLKKKILQTRNQTHQIKLEFQDLKRVYTEKMKLHFALQQQGNYLQNVLGYNKKKQLLDRMEVYYGRLNNQQNSMDKYLHTLDKIRVKQQQFQQIKNITGVTSVNQLVNYNQYLNQNRIILTQALNQALQKEKILSEQRKRKNKELNEFALQHVQERKLNPKEFEELELYLNERNLDMKQNQAVLENLLRLITQACIGVSRLSAQLLGGSEGVDCKHRNVSKYLTACGQKLESKLEKINEFSGFWQEESINTSTKFQVPPQWLHLTARDNSGFSR